MAEIEIKKAIECFIKFSELQISDEQVEKFMELNKTRRRLSLTKDIFISICDFLNTKDMLVFGRINNESATYIPYIWPIIMYRYHPKSLIPSHDMEYIKLQLSLDIYYCDVKYFDEDKSWIDLKENERILYKLHRAIDEIKLTSVNSSVRLITNKSEARSVNADRNDALLSLRPEYVDVIHNFQWNSIQHSVPHFVKYWTIKPELDMRLRGYDISIPEQNSQANIHFKWISGIFHERWENNDIQDPVEPEFEYEVDFHEMSRRRKRIRPEWVD